MAQSVSQRGQRTEVAALAEAMTDDGNEDRQGSSLKQQLLVEDHSQCPNMLRPWHIDVLTVQRPLKREAL